MQSKTGKNCPLQKSTHLSTSKQRDVCWESVKKTERLPVSENFLWVRPWARKLQTTYMRFRSLLTVLVILRRKFQNIKPWKSQWNQLCHFWQIFHMKTPMFQIISTQCGRCAFGTCSTLNTHPTNGFRFLLREELLRVQTPPLQNFPKYLTRQTLGSITAKSMPPSHIGHIFMKPILQDNDWLSKPSHHKTKYNQFIKWD